jgi:hypothetical protein
LFRSSFGIRIAEETTKTLQTQIEQLAQDSNSEDSASLIRSEAEARQELVTVQQRVESIHKLLGPDGNSDLSDMTKKLQAAIDREQVLEAKIAAQEAVSHARISQNVDFFRNQNGRFD